MAKLPITTILLLLVVAMFFMYSPFLFQVLYRWIKGAKVNGTTPRVKAGNV